MQEPWLTAGVHRCAAHPACGDMGDLAEDVQFQGPAQGPQLIAEASQVSWHITDLASWYIQTSRECVRVDLLDCGLHAPTCSSQSCKTSSSNGSQSPQQMKAKPQRSNHKL